MKRGPRYRSRSNVRRPGDLVVGHLKLFIPPPYGNGIPFISNEIRDDPASGFYGTTEGTIERCWDDVHVDPTVALNREIRRVSNLIRKGQKGPQYSKSRKRKPKTKDDPDYTGSYVNAEDHVRTHVFRTSRRNHGVVEVTSAPPRVHYPFPLLERIRLPKKLRKTQDYDVGGPFLKTRATFQIGRQAVDTYTVPGFITSRYSGGFIPTSFGNYDYLDTPSRGNLGLPDLARDLDMDAFGYGAQAWNKFRPKLEIADVGLFLAEISDVPEQFKTSAKAFHEAWRAVGGHPLHFGPKAAAEHFINHQFGWKPFLNDLRGMLNSMTDGDRHLQQLRCDNDQWIRRRGTVTVSEGIDHVEDHRSAQVHPTLNSGFLEDPFTMGHSTTYIEHYDRVWFSGKFKYFVPSLLEVDDPVARGVNDINNWIIQNGLRVSPSLIYRATPWTWLVDWFTGFGDIVSNATAIGQDHLIAQYAYVMRQRVVRAYNRTQLRFREGVPLSQQRIKNCLWYKEFVTKHRVAASPFGFGTLKTDLSVTQLAILGALGISYAL